MLLHPEPQAFTFDMVAGEAADQDAIFRGACPTFRVSQIQALNSFMLWSAVGEYCSNHAASPWASELKPTEQKLLMR